MGRSEEFGGSQSPVEKYLSWSSEANSFKFWDGEKNEVLTLPYSFIVLKEVHTVVGWSDQNNAAIFSNSIVNLKSDILSVRVKGHNVIAQGTYDEIKDKVKNAGGKYAKIIYVFDGCEIQAITLKGAALTSWINFSNDNRDAVKYNFITVASFESKKKGKTEYSEPVFTPGAKIEDDMSKTADDAYEVVKTYVSKASSPKTEEATPATRATEALPEAELPDSPWKD